MACREELDDLKLERQRMLEELEELRHMVKHDPWSALGRLPVATRMRIPMRDSQRAGQVLT